MQIYKMLIRPVLTYSSETMALTKNDIRMMDGFERRLVFTRHKLSAMDRTCCAVTILASDTGTAYSTRPGTSKITFLTFPFSTNVQNHVKILYEEMLMLCFHVATKIMVHPFKNIWVFQCPYLCSSIIGYDYFPPET
jgi:hypothetical protein